MVNVLCYAFSYLSPSSRLPVRWVRLMSYDGLPQVWRPVRIQHRNYALVLGLPSPHAAAQLPFSLRETVPFPFLTFIRV